MRLHSLPVLVIAGLTFGNSRIRSEPDPESGPKTLGERLIATIPQAAEGEFDSPEAAARAFVEGLIEDDWDPVLKSTTIRLRCDRVGFEARAIDTGSVLPHEAADLSSPLAQFMSQMQSTRGFRQIQLVLAGVKDPTKMQLLKVDREAPDRAALSALKKEVLYRRPKELRLIAIEENLELGEKTWEAFRKRETIKELGATGATWLITTVGGVPGTGEIGLDLVVLKVGSNWLVESVFLP